MLWLLGHSRRWLLFSCIVILLGGAWIWASRVPASIADLGQIPSPRAGFAAPDFTLETFAGEQVTLSAQRGKVVVINLWASWCGPCRTEMPAIQRVYDTKRERGLEVLAVNSTVQDDAAKAQAFVQELGLSFPIVLDRDGAVTRRYLVRGLPSTFIVDRTGMVREVIFGGPLNEATLVSKIDPLLEEQ